MPVLTRLSGPAGAAALVGTATIALQVRDPHLHSWGACPMLALTGWDCPFCGGLRAVNDLGHGHIVAAAHSNLVLVAALPLLLFAWLWWTRRRWAGDRSPVPAALVRRVSVFSAVVLVAFTVVRNTPWGAGLHVS